MWSVTSNEEKKYQVDKMAFGVSETVNLLTPENYQEMYFMGLELKSTC